MRKYKKIIGVPLDRVVKQALLDAVSELGNAAILAQRIGVKPGSVRMWTAPNPTRAVKTIPEDTWDKVYRVIGKKLPREPQYLPKIIRDCAGASAPRPSAAPPNAALSYAEPRTTAISVCEDEVAYRPDISRIAQDGYEIALLRAFRDLPAMVRVKWLMDISQAAMAEKEKESTRPAVNGG